MKKIFTLLVVLMTTLGAFATELQDKMSTSYDGVLTVSGTPIDQTVSFTMNADGTVDALISNLTVGTLSIGDVTVPSCTLTASATEGYDVDIQGSTDFMYMGMIKIPFTIAGNATTDKLNILITANLMGTAMEFTFVAPKPIDSVDPEVEQDNVVAPGKYTATATITPTEAATTYGSMDANVKAMLDNFSGTYTSLTPVVISGDEKLLTITCTDENILTDYTIVNNRIHFSAEKSNTYRGFQCRLCSASGDENGYAEVTLDSEDPTKFHVADFGIQVYISTYNMWVTAGIITDFVATPYVEPAKIYVIGDFNGWNPEGDDLVLEPNDFGVYSFTKFFDTKQYIALGTQLGEWSVFNASRIATDVADDNVYNGYTGALVTPSENAFCVPAGAWTFEISLKDMTMTVTNAGADYPIYAIGNLDGTTWDPSSSAVTLTFNDASQKYEGTITVEDASEGYGWFAFSTVLGADNSDWETFNAHRLTAGPNCDTLDAELTLSVGVDEAFKLAAGDYNVALDLAAGTVIITKVEATGISTANETMSTTRKVINRGSIIIESNGRRFNALGAQLR